jgi:hypothetical protein
MLIDSAVEIWYNVFMNGGIEMTKKWFGTWPANCDQCKVPLTNFREFYDARSYNGRWGLFCPQCKVWLCGTRVGTGIAQMYDSKTLIKIEG